MSSGTPMSSGIDILLVGGNYFFSDKFDAYAIFPLKEVYLNGLYRSDLVDLIRKGWNEFLNNLSKKGREVINKNFKVDSIIRHPWNFVSGEILNIFTEKLLL